MCVKFIEPTILIVVPAILIVGNTVSLLSSLSEIVVTVTVVEPTTLTVTTISY